jgi:hypothetical protein
MSRKRVFRVLVLAVFTLSLAQAAAAQVLSRHVAEFRFGGEQVSMNTATGIGTGGDTIYLKTFFLPPGEETIFVTLSSTGDTHGGAASWFSASSTGCSSGTSASASTGGC